MTSARWAWCLAVMVAIASAPRSAPACDFGQSSATIDRALRATDQVPPTFPSPDPVKVMRGQAPRRDAGCGTTVTSCDDTGNFQIYVAASDDQTAPLRIGYRVRVAGGTPPSDLSVPAEPVVALSGVLVLSWPDGATDDQEAIDVSLEITAIDGAGNESAPQTVRVQDGGSGGGCRLTARPIGDTPVFLLVAAVMALAARRRRAS